MTGFSKPVRDLVFRRAAGRCERCGLARPHYEYHHRRPRAMGGSSSLQTNGAANCLLLCAVCHRVVEQHRTVARDRGFLVSQWANPSEVPVHRYGEGFVLLDDQGRVIKQ